MPAATRLEPDIDRASDADLVCLGRQGNQRALRALYDRYERQVLRWCAVSARGDPERARDLAQGIWASTFRALPNIDPQRFFAFLATVVRNACRGNAARDRRRSVLEVLVDLEAFDLEVVDDRCENVMEQQDREHRNAIVREVLARVTDPQMRRIAEMKYCDPEHTADQIAGLLGLSRGTVLVKLMRFRAAIRRQLLAALLEDERWGRS